MDLFDFFNVYTREMGWDVIPIKPRSKVPCHKNWNKKHRPPCLDYLKSHRNCNLGLLLGNIIDVEGDTYEDNIFLNQLIGDYQHPQYKSEKSTHHLFLSPWSDFTIAVAKNIRFHHHEIKRIEFRGCKHQSVVPPSINYNGFRYNWLAFPSVPVMPTLLKNLLQVIAPDKPSCYRDSLCNACGRLEAIHPKRLKLEIHAFQVFGQKWQCKECRKIDVREMCRQIKTGNVITLPV